MQVEARVGQHDARPGAGGRDAEQVVVLLGLRARTRDALAVLVEQQGILGGGTRKGAFIEPGKEYEVEGHAARLLDRRDPHLAVARPFFGTAQPAQCRLDDQQNVIQAHRPDTGHRLKLIEEFGDGVAEAQRGAGEFAQRVQPLAPQRAAGERDPAAR